MAADACIGARELTDPSRLARILESHEQLYAGASSTVLATLWWYLASAVVIGPTAAGALVGVPLSAALDDLEVSVNTAGVVSSAVSRAPGPKDPPPALGETLGVLISALCAETGLRCRRLWAIAVDSLANRLLTFGRLLHEVERATSLAEELAASSGSPVPGPRFVDVGGARFVDRMSCCWLYRVPGGEVCTSCPRRTADERTALLLLAAPRFRSVSRTRDAQRLCYRCEGAGVGPARVTSRASGRPLDQLFRWSASRWPAFPSRELGSAHEYIARLQVDHHETVPLSSGDHSQVNLWRRSSWIVVPDRPRSQSTSSLCALGRARRAPLRGEAAGPPLPAWWTGQYP